MKIYIKTREPDVAIHYPVTVDAKKLTALILTGDAIIRAPNQGRIDAWNQIKSIIWHQCQPPNEKSSVPQPETAAAGQHVAKGVCIVCGSAMVLAFWRGHNRKVQCNDCGSEVSELLHLRYQVRAQ